MYYVVRFVGVLCPEPLERDSDQRSIHLEKIQEMMKIHFLQG